MKTSLVYSYPFVFFLFLVALTPGGAVAAPAVVVLSEAPAAEELKAAEELAYYWGRITDSAVRVVGEAEFSGMREVRRVERPRYHRFGSWRPVPEPDRSGIVFYVGETAAAERTVTIPKDLDRDGFVLQGGGKRLFLRGASPEGTRFAVYRFLSEYAGVQWFLPTELGEQLPDWTRDRLPPIRRVEEPAFLSRRWSGASRFTENDWETRNLMRGRYNFHHSLHKIFTEAVYEIRPDFFIQLDGKRVRPNDALGGLNYQICFGNPDAAKYAGRKAAEFFEANPEAVSFALGMTDTYGICECSDCRRWVDPEKTFRGRPDYSDLVFTFLNRAAEELAETHPDKYLGTLAYYWAENVPSFPVHPKVIPYLTADRGMWQDETFRKEDRELMARWAAAGPEKLGIYDYYYGTAFVIPRLFTKVTAESLRHANAVGIDGFYAEISSNWSLDGPKAWLTSQLLWEPTRSREELLDLFYEGFFGRAATPMEAFWSRAEEIWMEQGPPVFWLKFYFDFTQLELFPSSVCEELRGYLAEAAALAEDVRVRKRVELVSEAFRVTELYSEFYHGLKTAAAEAGDLDRGELILALETALERRRMLETYYDEVVLPTPLHRPRNRMEEKARFLPGTKVARLVERVLELSRASGEESGESFETLLKELAEFFPESRVGLLSDHRGGFAREILVNGGFDWAERSADPVENPDVTPLLWNRLVHPVAPEDPSAGWVITDEGAASAPFAVRARGLKKEVLTQRFSVEPEAVYRFSVRARGKVSPGSRIEAELVWRDAEGRRVEGTYLHLDRLLPGRTEDWRTLLVIGAPPDGAVAGFATLTVQDQAPGDEVYFDDASLKRN